MAVNIARIYIGLVTVGPTLAGGPDAYLGDNYHLTFILKNSLFAAQVLVLDAVVVCPSVLSQSTISSFLHVYNCLDL